jgi:hypothetical protein
MLRCCVLRCCHPWQRRHRWTPFPHPTQSGSLAGPRQRRLAGLLEELVQPRILAHLAGVVRVG